MPTVKKKAGPDFERLDRTLAAARRAHDNEHQRYLDQPGMAAGDSERTPQATHTPFANLATLLKKDG
jgi:hypothetical protein